MKETIETEEKKELIELRKYKENSEKSEPLDEITEHFRKLSKEGNKSMMLFSLGTIDRLMYRSIDFEMFKSIDEMDLCLNRYFSKLKGESSREQMKSNSIVWDEKIGHDKINEQIQKGRYLFHSLRIGMKLIENELKYKEGTMAYVNEVEREYKDNKMKDWLTKTQNKELIDTALKDYTEQHLKISRLGLLKKEDKGC